MNEYPSILSQFLLKLGVLGWQWTGANEGMMTLFTDITRSYWLQASCLQSFCCCLGVTNPEIANFMQFCAHSVVFMGKCWPIGHTYQLPSTFGRPWELGENQNTSDLHYILPWLPQAGPKQCAVKTPCAVKQHLCINTFFYRLHNKLHWAWVICRKRIVYYCVAHVFECWSSGNICALPASTESYIVYAIKKYENKAALRCTCTE